MLKHIRPNRLRASIAAPRAPNRTGHEEQADTGHDQKSGNEVEFVWPYLDVEHVETAIGQVDQHRLIRRIRPAIPADPRRHVVNRQRDQHDQPLEAAKWAVDALVMNRLALLVEPLLGRRTGRSRFRDGIGRMGIKRSAPIPLGRVQGVRAGHRLRPPGPRQPSRSPRRVRACLRIGPLQGRSVPRRHRANRCRWQAS